MLISRVSMVTGKAHDREINITEEQYAELNRPSRRLIQEIVPHLSASDREFLMTGITPEEWERTFPPEEDEE